MTMDKCAACTVLRIGGRVIDQDQRGDRTSAAAFVRKGKSRSNTANRRDASRADADKCDSREWHEAIRAGERVLILRARPQDTALYRRTDTGTATKQRATILRDVMKSDSAAREITLPERDRKAADPLGSLPGP
jgi:hypothetical protein